MRYLLATASVLALTVPGFTMAGEITHTKYACDSNKILDVVYIKDYAVILDTDELIPMKRSVSGSGVRYVSISKDYTYELWGKGNNMNLSSNDGKNSEAILNNCQP